MECLLENITIHYEMFGDGKPIIILPGWGLNTRFSADQVEPYFKERKGWKRVYIDPPGHGKTPGTEQITNLDELLEIVLACVDKLTEGQNFGLIGISLGAYLARGLLLHRANLIDGLAMLVPGIITEDAKRDVPPYQVLIDKLEIDEELNQMEEYILGMSVIRTKGVLNEIRNLPQVPENEDGDPEFLGKIRDNPKNYAFSFDVDAKIETFPRPVLIVTGRQDHIVGYRDAWNILDKFPRASYVVLDRMGHFMEESNALISVLMNEWLDRVEESSKKT